ncbi:MAG: sigma 54-interacting transcriptional regulator [Desulfobacterales bacterium]|jgi:PAS domain S-box-containing protein
MKVKQGEIRYKDIFESTSNGVIATDILGSIVLFNRQAVEILKKGEKLVLGKSVLKALPATGPLVMKSLQTGEPQLGYHVYGKRVSLVANITPIRRDTQIIGAMCNFQPMQQFEDSARKLESYVKLNVELETVFQTSSDGIVVYDGDGRVRTMNEVAAIYDGVKAEDVIGMHYTEMIKTGILDRSVVPEVMKAKKKVSALVKVRRTNKTLLVTGAPAFDETGKISLIVVSFHDMTQLNNILEQLEQSRMVADKYEEELAELSLGELDKHKVVMESEPTRQVFQMAIKLAKMEVSNILISGESGTGKGLLAKFIHKNSRRTKKPFIQINCAAVPENLLEAELFGYEKGAFTGANDRGKAGLFELAHKGTLFLDEIGDMPLGIQAKLLKYLDDQEVMRLGSVKPKTIDCIIVAATNQNLVDLVKKKKFREDLLYRLNTFPIEIPPLRERPEDIFELTRYFLKKYNTQYKLKRKITSDGIEKMQVYPFRGNVRELKNIIKKAVVLSERQKIDSIVVRSLQTAKDNVKKNIPKKKKKLKLSDEILTLEKQLIKDAMKNCRNLREIAHELGISEPTAFRKMKKHGLSF